MDVDGSPAPPASAEAPQDAGQNEQLQQLSDIFEALGNNPYDYGKHQEHLAVARQLGPDAVYAAREWLATYFPLSAGKSCGCVRTSN